MLLWLALAGKATVAIYLSLQRAPFLATRNSQSACKYVYIQAYTDRQGRKVGQASELVDGTAVVRIRVVVSRERALHVQRWQPCSSRSIVASAPGLHLKKNQIVQRPLPRYQTNRHAR